MVASKLKSGQLARLWDRTLDVLLPPSCLSCGARVEQQGTLCFVCWNALHWLSAPLCSCCGFPFDYDLGDQGLCGACTVRRPSYDRARAALAYDDASRHLVTSLKYNDRLEGAPTYALWMARAGGELIAGADLIIPVPLHPLRLFTRRFNQAALLAQGVARPSGQRRLRTDILRRTRRTRQQVGLSAAARRLNVAHAFALTGKGHDQVRGRAVLLIDDVLTTGATVEACARVLKRAGAARVDVLTLARVVAAREPPI